MGGLVLSTLNKGDTIIVDGKEYKIVSKNNIRTIIKQGSKTGTIIHTSTDNITWAHRNKRDVAGEFFRGIESDIVRCLLDENNPFNPTITDSYRIIKKMI